MAVRRWGPWVLMVLACASGVAAAKADSCPGTLSACPKRGCAKQGSPGAFANAVKRNLNPRGETTRLGFEDFRTLQARVEEKFGGEYHTLTRPDRLRLRHLDIGGRTVGEGDRVELLGFIAVKPGKSKPHANTGESVNCNLTGAGNNDFHISLTPRADGSEYSGIVVEMIPQKRDDEWTEGRLRKVQARPLMVRARGQLFFDNHHRVNTEADRLGNQPKRFSLWEIHPVTEFDVCTKTSCTPDGTGWLPLAQWQP